MDGDRAALQIGTLRTRTVLGRGDCTPGLPCEQIIATLTNGIEVTFVQRCPGHWDQPDGRRRYHQRERP